MGWDIHYSTEPHSDWAAGWWSHPVFLVAASSTSNRPIAAGGGHGGCRRMGILGLDAHDLPSDVDGACSSSHCQRQHAAWHGTHRAGLGESAVRAHRVYASAVFVAHVN